MIKKTKMRRGRKYLDHKERKTEKGKKRETKIKE